MSLVLTTAGHRGHGKSALVRSLEGRQPARLSDQWRGDRAGDLTVTCATLNGGASIALVDVPGHEESITTMLAGAGPAQAALVVVAADLGWQDQSDEHLALLEALGIAHGLLVVTRSDLADPSPALTHARQRLARSGLAHIEALAVSARTGAGVAQVRDGLGRLVTQVPRRTRGPVRLFVDDAFPAPGTGILVTGALTGGCLRIGDHLVLGPGQVTARVGAVHVDGAPRQGVSASVHVEITLHGLPRMRVRRGMTLCTPGAWPETDVVDARLTDLDPADLTGDVTLHFGTAAVACRLQPLGKDTCRVHLARPLALVAGDRAALRHASPRLVTGLDVLDPDPPVLAGRGAVRDRSRLLADGLDGWRVGRGVVRPRRTSEQFRAPDWAAPAPTSSPTLIDARSPDAYFGWTIERRAGGHLPGAVDLPAEYVVRWGDPAFTDVVERKGLQRARPTVVMDDGGGEAAIVAARLISAGFREVTTTSEFGPGPLDRLARHHRLVPVGWLATHGRGAVGEERPTGDIRVLHIGRHAEAGFVARHIGAATYLDTDELEAPPRWNRRPLAGLRDRLRRHGVTDRCTAVLYGEDQAAVARAAVVFRHAGVVDVRVLRGGLRAWRDSGLPVATGVVRPEPAQSFVTGTTSGLPDHATLADLHDLHHLARAGPLQLLDTRTWAEHTGRVSGYTYLRTRGRIPGAVFVGDDHAAAQRTTMLRYPGGEMRNPMEALAEWRGRGVRAFEASAFFCGTGWRASEAYWTAYLAGWTDMWVYDGGWLEWSQDQLRAIERGPR